MPASPNNIYFDSAWQGVDTYHSPGKVRPGFLSAAVDCLLDGGDVVSRPGWTGLLAAAFPGPAYVLETFYTDAGLPRLIVSSGGKLYFLDPSTTVATEIKDAGGASLTHNSPTAFVRRLGNFGYLIDGTIRPLRFDLTSGKPTPFLLAPTSAPAVALTSTPIDSLLYSWTADSLTGPGNVNRLPNADFSQSMSAGGHDTPTGWTVGAGDPDLYGQGHQYAGPNAHNQSGAWLLTDKPGENIYTTAAIPNDPISTDAARHASQFFAALTLFQSDSSGLSLVTFSLLAYADAAGTNLITEIAHDFPVPYSNQTGPVTLDYVFSLAALSVPVLSYRVRLTAGPQNNIGNNGIFCRQPVCFPFAPPVTATVSGGQVRVSEAAQIAYTGGTLTQSLPGTVGMGKGAGGLVLTHDFGTDTDWSKYSQVVLALGKAAGIMGLSLSLSFRQNGSATRYYTNTFAVSADSAVATLDISTVPLSVRSAFRYVELVFGGDFAPPAANGTDLLLFGPLSGAGNLAVGEADYWWAYTEIDGSADIANLVNVIESNPSPNSVFLTPTVTQAEARITFPPPANTSTTGYVLYRGGGVFDDGLMRLVGVINRDGSAVPAFAANPYLTWDSAGRVLVDNTPDSFILPPGTFPVPGAGVVYGRDIPPLGAQAIAVTNGRLLLGVGSELYISWLHTAASDALYFTYANIPGDPYEEVKGRTAPVGEARNGDPIVTITPYNSAPVGNTVRSKYLVEGTNGGNFEIVEYLKGGGYGCSAARAACLVHNQEFFLAESGPFLFDGAGAHPFGKYIEREFFRRGLIAGGGSPNYKACAAVYHDRRLLLSFPGASSATNSRTFVYDTRYAGTPDAGWTVWNRGFTSAVTTSGDTGRDGCYVGGQDGQVYKLDYSEAGAGKDTAKPGATPSPVSLVAQTRGYGQEGGGEAFFQGDTSLSALALVSAPAGTVVTMRTASDSPDSFADNQPYTTSKPYEKVGYNPRDVEGFYLTLQVTLTPPAGSTGRVRLSGLLLRSVPGSEAD